MISKEKGHCPLSLICPFQGRLMGGLAPLHLEESKFGPVEKWDFNAPIHSFK